MKFGFIGCGNMGEALLKGALASGNFSSENIVVSAKSEQTKAKIAGEYGVKIATNDEVAQECDVIILAIKPNKYEEVLSEIREHLNSEKCIIGIAPGFTLKKLAELANEAKVMRAMPNTPAAVGKALTALSVSERMSREIVEAVVALFKSVGSVKLVDESQMVAVVATTGSGVAYVYMMIEAMAEGAIKLGMSHKDAYYFSAKAFEGAAAMVLEAKKHPARLRDDVSSPAGTTIEGVLSLERSGAKGMMIDAMLATAEAFDKANK